MSLAIDKPAHGLKSGDTGTIVEIYESGGLEVEFMDGAGKTKAVLTLEESNVQHLIEK